MDILFIFFGLVFMLVGIVGSILPVIPGTPLSWIGLILLHLAPRIEFDWWLIVITGIIAIAIYVLDYIIPSIGTKKFGGSKAGVWGTLIGLFVGILAPIPAGIILGPFVGALIGEMVFNGTEGKQAVKAAFGSFLGFMTSTFIKLMVTLIYLCIFVYLVFWSYWDLLTA